MSTDDDEQPDKSKEDDSPAEKSKEEDSSAEKSKEDDSPAKKSSGSGYSSKKPGGAAPTGAKKSNTGCILIAVILLLVGGVGVGLSVCFCGPVVWAFFGVSSVTHDRPHVTTAEVPSKAPVTTPERPVDAPETEQPAVKLSAGQLLKQFKDNEAKATGQYKGKTVVVTGAIKKIAGDHVELKGTEPAESRTVDCYFKDGKVMATLKSGSEITVRGIVEEKSAGAIKIKGCALEK